MFRICEIYKTIMGESGYAGYPCTIIRTSGCNLTCAYCDTGYANTDYEDISLKGIIDRVDYPYPARVLVTGGEPMIQSDMPVLLGTLLNRGHKVFIETNGSMDLSKIDTGVIKIMDIKCPSSGQSHMNCFNNLNYLTQRDEVKFVVGDREDFLWAIDIIKQFNILASVPCLISPVYKKMEPQLLASWILEEALEVRLQVQLHKIIWGDRRGV